jgi:hypothetical protein
MPWIVTSPRVVNSGPGRLSPAGSYRRPLELPSSLTVSPTASSRPAPRESSAPGDQFVFSRSVSHCGLAKVSDNVPAERSILSCAPRTGPPENLVTTFTSSK